MNSVLAAAYSRPDPKPFLFQVGQTVRLLLGRSDDGQTPAIWDGAKVEIVSRYCTGLYKAHWYKVRLGEAVSEFEEDEIDARYARRSI